MIYKTHSLPKIKLPINEEHHFLQLHSSSTVGTLKASSITFFVVLQWLCSFYLQQKIFRKAPSLEGEKQDNYVLAIKQQSKVRHYKMEFIVINVCR